MCGSAGNPEWGSTVFESTAPVVKRLERVRGKVRYELKNFRGDVRQIISDVQYRELDGNGLVAYTADVYQVEDSYPFGWSIKERSFSVDQYRFGFNGMEKNPEIQDGNQDFGARMYDSRIGRWWGVDPENQFILSQYQSFLNNPILHVDPDGAWIPGVDENGNIFLTAEKGDNLYSLKRFFGREENAKKYLRNFYFSKGAETTLKIEEGAKITLKSDNPYSLAFKHAAENPEEYVDSDVNVKNSDIPTYNCHTSCVLGVQDKEFHNASNELFLDPQEVISIFSDKKVFTPVLPVEAEFGNTVLTFGWSHTAVYFGKSNNNTRYIFTKSGAYYAPEITKLVPFVKDANYNYGAVRSVHRDNENINNSRIGTTGQRLNENGKALNSPGYYTPSNKVNREVESKGEKKTRNLIEY